MTTSVVAETIWGLVYYLVHDGPFGGKATVYYPNVFGKKLPCGDVYLSYVPTDASDVANTTAPEIATA